MSGVPTPGVTRLPGRYARMLLIRGMAIWVSARLMVLALYVFVAASSRRSPDVAAAFTNGNPLVLAGWALALSAALVRVDLYRRHEVALLNNLGVITSHATLLGTLPAVVMETAMAIVR